MAGITDVGMNQDVYVGRTTMEVGQHILAAAPQIAQALNNRPSLGGGFVATDSIGTGKVWGNGTIRISVTPVLNPGWGAPPGTPFTPHHQVFIDGVTAAQVQEIKGVLISASNAPAGSGRRRKNRKTKKLSRRRRTTRRRF